MLVANTVFFAIFLTLIFYYIYIPELNDGDFYGDATRPIVWMCMILTPPAAYWSNLLQLWGDIVPVPCAKRTTAMIKDYASKLKAIFLVKNLMPHERLSRITKEQTRVETWARITHSSMSSVSGAYFASMLFFLLVCLATAAIAKSGASIAFAGFGVMVLLFISRFLWAQTLQSRTFKKVKVQLLNDANLIPGIHEALQGRFDLWWESHEISASTMFSIKMTTHRVLKALLGLGSVVIIVAGLLVRQAMGIGGGGLMR